MRTSINIDDHIFYEAKKLAMESKQSFASIVEDALRTMFERKMDKKAHISLLTTKGNGLQHGVDLDDNHSLNNIMDN